MGARQATDESSIENSSSGDIIGGVGRQQLKVLGNGSSGNSSGAVGRQYRRNKIFIFSCLFMALDGVGEKSSLERTRVLYLYKESICYQLIQTIICVFCMIQTCNIIGSENSRCRTREDFIVWLWISQGLSTLKMLQRCHYCASV